MACELVGRNRGRAGHLRMCRMLDRFGRSPPNARCVDLENDRAAARRSVLRFDCKRFCVTCPTHAAPNGTNVEATKAPEPEKRRDRFPAEFVSDR